MKMEAGATVSDWVVRGVVGDMSYALYRECAGQGSVEVRDKT
jgi:hypothetical protein